MRSLDPTVNSDLADSESHESPHLVVWDYTGPRIIPEPANRNAEQWCSLPGIQLRLRAVARESMSCRPNWQLFPFQSPRVPPWQQCGH